VRENLRGALAFLDDLLLEASTSPASFAISSATATVTASKRRGALTA
jgi:hypothetical protein